MSREIDPEAISLDEAFLELRRITTFAVATRLNPDLARWFDEPPVDYRLPGLDGGLQGTQESDSTRWTGDPDR